MKQIGIVFRLGLCLLVMRKDHPSISGSVSGCVSALISGPANGPRNRAEAREIRLSKKEEGFKK